VIERRRRIVDVGWSILVAFALVWLHVDHRIWLMIDAQAREQLLQRYLTIPAFLLIYFACWSGLCLPVQAFRHRLRASVWLNSMLEHGLMFTIGGSLLMVCQILSPAHWNVGFTIVLAILLLLDLLWERSPAAGLFVLVGWCLTQRFVAPALVGSPIWCTHAAAILGLWCAVSRRTNRAGRWVGLSGGFVMH